MIIALHVFLALVNGILIGVGRVVNGRLAISVGAFRTSLRNHLAGFLFLVPIAVVLYGFTPPIFSSAPLWAWAGGVLGVGFVAINAHVIPRLGASATAAFVVAAQMITSLVIDVAQRGTTIGFLGAAGALLIVVGVALQAGGGQKLFAKRNNVSA